MDAEDAETNLFTFAATAASRTLNVPASLVMGARLSRTRLRMLGSSGISIQMPSGVYVAVWEGALKNYGINMGYDYGGRLQAAWLDR